MRTTSQIAVARFRRATSRIGVVEFGHPDAFGTLVSGATVPRGSRGEVTPSLASIVMIAVRDDGKPGKQRAGPVIGEAVTENSST